MPLGSCNIVDMQKLVEGAQSIVHSRSEASASGRKKPFPVA